MLSHIEIAILIIRSKAGRHSCAVLRLRELDKEETGKERSIVSGTCWVHFHIADMAYRRSDKTLRQPTRRSHINLDNNRRRQSTTTTRMVPYFDRAQSL